LVRKPGSVPKSHHDHRDRRGRPGWHAADEAGRL